MSLIEVDERTTSDVAVVMMYDVENDEVVVDMWDIPSGEWHRMTPEKSKARDCFIHPHCYTTEHSLQEKIVVAGS